MKRRPSSSELARSNPSPFRPKRLGRKLPAALRPKALSPSRGEGGVGVFRMPNTHEMCVLIAEVRVPERESCLPTEGPLRPPCAALDLSR